MNKIEVCKVELTEGEELQGMIKKVIDAITRSKGKTKKSLHLAGIYKDHIITRDFESGRFFKMKMERDGDVIKLSDEAEVRQVFVPVKQKTEKAEADQFCLVAIEAEKDSASVVTVKADTVTVQGLIEDIADGIDAPDYQDVKEKDLWEGVL